MMLGAENLRAMIQVISEKITAHQEELNRLDAALGDGDHGTAISIGFAATLEPIQETSTPSEVLKVAAMQLMNRMGGTSGALYGTLFLKAAMSVSNSEEITPQQFADMWQAGRDGVMQRGKAQIGDKTMLDALSPAVDTLKQTLDSGDSFSEALRAAADAAASGAESTSELQAKHGRAKYIGKRALGHVDAGAKSVALMFRAMTEYHEESQRGKA